ncbi:acylneuraminate cytidylyltransferase [bacterium]|nr:acylneuraminate cytidylyltransferase [bacterium]|tara:strand:+ start:272 stop:907 length:636 start_codon:yes stop_codon:yes gene_type:complete
MKTVSVILARGGSKAIPRKNIVDVNGKPLLWYVANASMNSVVDETWVSTNCPDIKRVALDIGCKVIDRPDEISQDHSKSDEALGHFAENVNFDILVTIQPTSPLLEFYDINRGLGMIDEYDSVFSVCKEHWTPRWTMGVEPHNWNINNRPMRQDVDELYLENGAFYITKRNHLLDSGLRYSGKMGVVEMPALRSFQIDTTEDLDLIRKIME